MSILTPFNNPETGFSKSKTSLEDFNPRHNFYIETFRQKNTSEGLPSEVLLEKLVNNP